MANRLGITEQDWSNLLQLSSSEKGWVIKEVEKVGPETVEVTFKKPDDRWNDRGGISFRYVRKDGVWKKDELFFGEWAVCKE